MKIAIFTDFVYHDEAYSLCRVVANQTRMIVGLGGYACKVLVHQKFNDHQAYQGAQIVGLDPGEVGNNIVNVTAESAQEIEHLTNQIRQALADVGVVLTHDLIYQPNMWKHHIACRRVARERPDLKWLHWVHSATVMYGSEDVGAFGQGLQGAFPCSKLVVMHPEERMRKMASFGFQPHQTVIIPNPLNITAHYHPAAVEAIEKASLWHADCIAVYPCRLDRGKQPHIVIEIFAELVKTGIDARVVIVDFHSLTGDKADYRNEMKAQANLAGVPVLFTSDLEYPEAEYLIPHQAVMDLFDFADVLVHPSKSESDPLIVPEAAWKRCGLVLNFDLPLFRAYEGHSLLYKFSSNIDVTTGMMGETKTDYSDRREYMRHVAGGIAYTLANDPVLYNHVRVRKERSLPVVWERNLWPALATTGLLDKLEVAGLTKKRHGLASIIVPCYLMPDKDGELLDFTQRCVESIKEYMDNYELVIVDNGSPIGADYLESVADVYIRNPINLGFAPAVNQGLQAATGEWLVVCNNDVEFVHDWLERAIGAWDEKTGIICPHLLDHDPQMRVGREVPRSPGYFMGALWMVSREVYEDVGELDEQFEMGMFEDKDYVNRVLETDRQLVKIGHIKHIGNATWGKLENQHEIYVANKEKFEAKWASG